MVIRVSVRRNVRILLVGDRGVGKTSLILSLVSEEFPEEVPAKAEEITIPADVTPEMVPTHIVDYSAAEQSDMMLVDEMQRSHVICVVYSITDEESLFRVTTHWLPLIRDTFTHNRIPVILVGNKVDLVDYSTVDAAGDIMDEFPEVESFVECSAKSLKNISEMFYFAQKAVLHPTGPVYIADSQDLTEECKKALTRIFKICDSDNDGLLNDMELNAFQKRCFDSPLRSEAMEEVKAVIRRNISGGVSPNNSITLTGFLFLHCLFIQRGRSHTTWTVLRKFGYNENLKMAKDYLFPRVSVGSGSSTELSHKGQQFLKSLFERYDQDRDGALSPYEQDSLFSLCPAPPWGSDLSRIVPTNEQTTRQELYGMFFDDFIQSKICKLFRHFSVGIAKGWVTMRGFLCFWELQTLHNLPTTLEYLAYFGYQITDHENQLSAIVVTRKKQLDIAKRQSTRNVYECHVYGAKGVGKAALCRSHIGQNQENGEEVDGRAQCTVNLLHVYGQEKYLVLRNMVSAAPADISCDVICLVYDATDPSSFEQVARIYTRHLADCDVPVLVVCNKCERGEARQNYPVQPSMFCDEHKLSPPHLFSTTHPAGLRAELFVKLSTMAAFPRFHAAWMLFYRHTRHLKELTILSGESVLWKAGIGIIFATALGLIFTRLFKTDKR